MKSRNTGIRRYGELVLLAVLLGGAVALWKPVDAESLEEHEVSLAAVANHEYEGRKILWVDARADFAYHRAHIPGAVHLNETNWNARFGAFLEHWSPDMAVVVYCDHAACRTSHAVAERLRAELGLESVYVLHGGWAVWRQGEEVEPRQGP